MSNGPLTIWCNAKFPDAVNEVLRAGVRRHRLVFSTNLGGNLASGEADPLLAGADVAFGQPDPDYAMDLPRLRWIHLTSAGYTRYDRADFRAALHERGARLTNSSGVYAEPCAQHLLAMMLALSRGLPEALENQRTGRGWPAAEIRQRSYLLKGQTALILGYGAIAQRVVQMLAPFEMKVTAVRRTVRGGESIPTIAPNDLPRLLPSADHILNTLPENAATRGFFAAPHFALLKPGAIFYNVGRGNTVDQDALLAALTAGRLAAAYLDVTDPEPLPPDHPLWTAPRCYITPHTGGGHADEFHRLVRHFLANLERFTLGAPLIDEVMGSK